MTVRPAPAVDEFVRVFEAAWVFGRHPERSAHAAALVGAEHRFGAPPDPVAGLGASEGGIYGRFGYGLATREIEPLQWMLPDPRAFAVTALYDHLWIRLVDVPAALSGRGHGAEGSLVLDVTDGTCPWNAGRWRLDTGPAPAWMPGRPP